MSFAAPIAQQPANGLNYNFNQQPISLRIVNAVRTGGAPVSYAVEVSADPSFNGLAFNSDGIGEGADGTTAVQLPPLIGNTMYYWRWRAVVDGIAGEPSSAQSFFLRPNIVLFAPVLQQPGDGSAVFSARPTFTARNITPEGPAGTLSYEFQVSESVTFEPLAGGDTVQEHSGATTAWSPPFDLPEGDLFWRVRVKDLANDIEGPFSEPQSFERRFGIDLASVVYVLGPDISEWPQTATLTNVSKSGDVVCTDYDGGNHWPSAPFLGNPDSRVVGNQWVFLLRDGVWYGGAGHWLRPGQTCKPEYDEHFFVDGFQGREPFASYVPRSGDVIGFAVSTPARFYPADNTVDERTDVRLLVW
jgi:hypothetical protein